MSAGRHIREQTTVSYQLFKFVGPVREALALAIEALSWMEHEGLSERAAFAKASKQLQVTERGALRIAQLLVLETTRRRNFVDHIIRTAAAGQIELDSLQHGVTSFLRLFCYWTKFRGTSDRDLVRILQSARYALGWKVLQPIESILGRILSLTPSETTMTLRSEEKLALSVFHPAWFVSTCTFLLGRRAALELVGRNLTPASSYIRVNTLRGNEEACHREIESAGIETTPVEHMPCTFKLLSSKRPIVRTTLYRSGRITVQDKASILTTLVSAPKPGDCVLDVCAAPGAKSAHLAELMENKGAIYSVDKSPTRMAFWKRDISRLGAKITHPILADARKQLPVNIEADLVVLDPPCSNTGTFWKSPAAKWRMTPERVHQLAAIQHAMLGNASRFVRVGGTLVYSTCSVLAEENEQIINRFIRLNPDFESVESSPRLGQPGLYGLSASQRLYPHIHDCNGHFISKMKRTG